MAHTRVKTKQKGSEESHESCQNIGMIDDYKRMFLKEINNFIHFNT